jgi:hypothetical protein
MHLRSVHMPPLPERVVSPADDPCVFIYLSDEGMYRSAIHGNERGPERERDYIAPVGEN